MSHTELVASELRNQGFPIYQVRPDAVLVKFKNRPCSSMELTRALLEMVEDGLVTCSSIAGMGKVTINA